MSGNLRTVALLCQGMMTLPTRSCAVRSSGPFTDHLWLAVTAYIARLKGSSCEHTESNLLVALAGAAGAGPAVRT